MDETLNRIRQLYQKGDLSSCVEGLELANNVINGIVEVSLNLLKKKELDSFVIADRLSLFFQKYLVSLKTLTNSEDRELAFWASTLLIHYDINNEDVEENLINEVKYGISDKAEIATTILARTKNYKLKEAIEIRLGRIPDLDNKLIQFFKEKLSELE